MHMERKRKVIVGAAFALALAGGGAGVAQAVGGNDDDAERSATGADAERAKTAAIKLVPGGRVQAVERDDEKGAVWEVEVKNADGTTVDVRLGSAFEKVSIDADSESADSGASEKDE